LSGHEALDFLHPTLRVLPIVIVTYLAAGASLAQSRTQPQQAPKPADTSTMKMEDVSKWTQKQWNVAKAKWTEKEDAVE